MKRRSAQIRPSQSSVAGSDTASAGPMAATASVKVSDATSVASSTTLLTASSARSASAPWQTSKAAPSETRVSCAGDRSDVGNSVDRAAGTVSGNGIERVNDRAASIE
jgi:hypothetical protein